MQKVIKNIRFLNIVIMAVAVVVVFTSLAMINAKAAVDTTTYYLLSFDANNDFGTISGNQDNIQVQSGNSTKLPNCSYTKETINGPSVFLGWDTDKSTKEPAYKAGDNLTLTKNTVLYAIWDDVPAFKYVEYPDRYFSLEEALSGKITQEELLSTVIVYDNEDHLLINKTSAEVSATGSDEGVTIVGYDSNEFKSFTKSGAVSVKYQAKDSIGNINYLDIMVYIGDQNKKEQADTKVINKEYLNSEEYNEIDNSVKEQISAAFDNTVIETWEFSKEDIKNAKNWVENNGFAKTGEKDYSDFLNDFSECKK